MVSNASDDLPEPDSPVITTSWSRGISRSTFLRLCSRAPRMTIRSLAMAVYYKARLDGAPAGADGARATSSHPGGDPRQRRGRQRRVRAGDAGPRGQPEEGETREGRGADERTGQPGHRLRAGEPPREVGRIRER